MMTTMTTTPQRGAELGARDLYRVLDVPTNASAARIRGAYRRRAQQTHPDRRGGDTEEFQDVQRAYEVLGDASKRAHYDATGQTSEGPSIESEARDVLLMVVRGCLGQDAILGAVRAKIQGALADAKARGEADATLLKNLLRKSGKVRRRDAGPNLVQVLIEQEIERLRAEDPKLQRMKQVMTRALAMTGDYTEMIEPPVEETPLYSPTTAGTRWANVRFTI